MQPLADLLRPKNFDEMVGQSALVGTHGVLRRFMESGRFSNMIFYGPPGVGKTTAATILANASDKTLHRLNATTASLSDIKEVIASTASVFGSGGVLLYLDEIQYFNKKQQQSLLEFLEDGRITLIASTTENPYFYIYGALLSRCAVFEFKSVTPAEILPALQRGFSLLCKNEGEKTCEDGVLETIAASAGGDVRRALGILENAFYASDAILTAENAKTFTPAALSAFDRDGDGHYDILSGFQKSIRGSDPDAALREAALPTLLTYSGNERILSDATQAQTIAAVQSLPAGRVVLEPFTAGDHNYLAKDPATAAALDEALRKVTVEFLAGQLG